MALPACISLMAVIRHVVPPGSPFGLPAARRCHLGHDTAGGSAAPDATDPDEARRSGPRPASSKLTTQLPPGLARLSRLPQQTGVSRLTSGRNRQTSATLLQPGHGGEPPPRPAHLPGGPRAGGVPHDCEALPVAGRPPSAGKPVAGALAGPARRPGRPGWRAASRSARGIQRRGHPGVLADPSGHGFASWAARRVIAAGDQAAAHAGCRESPGRGPGERPPCAQTCG